MQKSYVLTFSLFLTLLLSSCESVNLSTLPASFSTENIMQVHQGMSSDEILELFGPPKSIRSAICGSATNNPWSCTTWEYGEFPYDEASFTFSGTQGSYILNNFEIDRD